MASSSLQTFSAPLRQSPSAAGYNLAMEIEDGVIDISKKTLTDVRPPRLFLQPTSN